MEIKVYEKTLFTKDDDACDKYFAAFKQTQLRLCNPKKYIMTKERDDDTTFSGIIVPRLVCSIWMVTDDTSNVFNVDKDS